jgi:hypothetical protein
MPGAEHARQVIDTQQMIPKLVLPSSHAALLGD